MAARSLPPVSAPEFGSQDPGASAKTLADRVPPGLDPGRHALFLDFDGTFVDFAPTPDSVELRPGSKALLERLSGRLGGALAMVSGRKIADIDGFLAPLKLPASGVHGQEFRPAAGDFRKQPATPDLDEARRRLSHLVRPDDPLLVEDKGGALVLHFRLHPEQRERAERLSQEAVAGLSDLHALEGHAIFEIRQRGISKALALQLFGDLPPFAGRLPVFIGDDTTDEDGFRAAAKAGGFGIKVGPGVTEAAYRLPDVTAVHDWLKRIA
jgi:trehalose 6-phosphate phosphatase